MPHSFARNEKISTLDPSSYKKSSYYELVSRLYSYPLFYFLGGNRQRSDFLFVSTQSGVPLLYLWESGTRMGKLLTPGDDAVFPIFGAAALHSSKPLVVFPKDRHGNSDYEIYLVDYSVDDTRRLAGPSGRIMYSFWARDDSWIIVGHDKQTVYARNLFADGTTRDLYTTDEQVLGAAYDYRKELLAISVGRESAKLAIIDVPTGKLLHWLPDAGIPPFYPPSVYPEKGLIAYTVDRGTNQELVIRKIDTQEELGRVRIPGFGFLEWVDEIHLFGVILDDGRLSPRTVDIREREWFPPLADVSALFSTVTRDGPVWVANSFFQPPFLQAVRDGKVVDLVPPSVASQEIRVENHHYRSFDGRTVQGWLLRNADPKAPIVMYLHGGPTSLQGDWWYPEIPAVALAGYHVFAPNFRGSDGFGKEFRDLNIGDLGGGDLLDVQCGAKYAAKILGSNDKPALFGGSYGGYLTLQELATRSDDWAGGVAIAPDTDWAETYELADAHYRRFCLHFFGGDPEQKRELYSDRSPITHLRTLTKPVLVLHGDNDNITPLEPVKKFAERAKQLNAPVYLLVTPDEGHGSLQNTNAIRDTVLTLEHLRKIFQLQVESLA